MSQRHGEELVSFPGDMVWCRGTTAQGTHGSFMSLFQRTGTAPPTCPAKPGIQTVHINSTSILDPNFMAILFLIS